jgi:hypothetical protein
MATRSPPIPTRSLHRSPAENRLPGWHGRVGGGCSRGASCSIMEAPGLFGLRSTPTRPRSPTECATRGGNFPTLMHQWVSPHSSHALVTHTILRDTRQRNTQNEASMPATHLRNELAAMPHPTQLTGVRATEMVVAARVAANPASCSRLRVLKHQAGEQAVRSRLLHVLPCDQNRAPAATSPSLLRAAGGHPYQAHPKDPRNQPPALGNRGGWRLQPQEVPRRCCWRAALAPEAGERVQDGSPHAPNQPGARASHPSWSW